LQEQRAVKDTAKTILPPTQKEIERTEKKRNLAEIPRSKDQVNAQIECPKIYHVVLIVLKMASYGKSFVVNKRESLYPSTGKHTTKSKKTPSLIVPPNFPGSITVTPTPTLLTSQRNDILLIILA
jgi:hypothetical protein